MKGIHSLYVEASESRESWEPVPAQVKNIALESPAES